MLRGQIFENKMLCDCVDNNPRKVMLVWNKRASYGLNPFLDDFTDYAKCDILLKNITKANRCVGIGTSLHTFIDVKGKDIFLPCISYNLNQTYT